MNCDKTQRVVKLMAAMAIGLSAVGTARADLFALSLGLNKIFRIDSTTLQTTRTYEVTPPYVPPFFFGDPVVSGLAFDGRRLTWSTTLGPGMHEFYQLDVVTERYLGPFRLAGPPGGETIVGLAAFPRLQPTNLLMATAPFQGTPGESTTPAAIYVYDTVVESADEIARLPLEYKAHSLDVDPTTGQVWLGTTNSRTATTDFVQLALPPPYGSNQAPIVRRVVKTAIPTGFPLRGLAFDGGQMFCVTSLGELSEIDRITGNVLRKVYIPNANRIGGLAGGVIVPEPSAAALLAAPLLRLVRRAAVNRRSR